MSGPNMTLKLLATIEGYYRPKDKEILKLARLARLNKLYLAYLKALRSPVLEAERTGEEARHKMFLNNLVEVVKMLEGHSYALYKFLKPVEHLSVDLDILVHSSHIGRVVARLREKGYRVLVSEPYTITMERRGFIVDLYIHPSAAWIVYMDGEALLREYTEDVEVEGCNARSISREAEVAVTAAHSVYKEHIVLLLDCITLWRWGNKKAYRAAENLGVGESIKILSSTCLKILRGTDAPTRIGMGELARAYTIKIIEDPVFRETTMNALKYMGQARAPKALIWKITRKTY
jgi:hypothetical protein